MELYHLSQNENLGHMNKSSKYQIESTFDNSTFNGMFMEPFDLFEQRLCTSPTVECCLKAIWMIYPPYSNFHIYRIISGSVIAAPHDLFVNRFVHDSLHTSEFWVSGDIKMQKIGHVQIQENHFFEKQDIYGEKVENQVRVVYPEFDITGQMLYINN